MLPPHAASSEVRQAGSILGGALRQLRPPPPEHTLQQSDAGWQPRWSCAVNTTVWMIYPGQAPTVTSPGMMLADIGGVSTGQGTGGYPQTGAGGHLGLDKTVSAAPS